MTVEIAIKVEELGKCYQVYEKPRDRLLQMFASGRRPRYREFWALKDVSLEVGKGETVGIIGRNGSGKSTLLQLICGTVTPSHGKVSTKGRVAALLELGSGFNPEYTGRENVYMNGSLLGIAHAEIDARFDEIADFANIGDFIDQPVGVYSSGMVVRLAFAVSVCVEPDVLVVDEALAVGDASFQFKCLDRLAALTERGTTLLFVSHDMAMVRRFCQRVVYLHQGEIRATGSPDEMAEFYLLDTRDEQRRWASCGAVPVTRKAFVGKQEGVAFGTDEGGIVSAAFSNTDDLYSSFLYGDNVEIRVEAIVRDTVRRPNISFTIQETRLMVIGGDNFALQPGTVENGWRKTSIAIRFRARLSVGRYHVTLKLLDGHTEDTSHLIEKQVALLAFDMLPGEKEFLGIVDLGLEEVAAAPKLAHGEPT